MFQIRLILPILVLALLPGTLVADHGDPLLFDSEDVLELTMPVDFDALCRPSESPDCDYSPTVFRYRDASGSEQTVPISIRRRDGWRAMQTNCQVPTLFVRFNADDVAGTLFEGQSELALTSHCGKGFSSRSARSRRLPDTFESYVINEYLGYRLYRLVTDVSLRVRLVRITYADPENPRKDFRHYAFFSEHFQSLARRFNAELLPPNSFDPERLDLQAADRLALFQYMVGNTDWSIVEQDNVVLIATKTGQQVPVMFDLDMSGLVFAHYAQPPPELPIRSVKQRYYQGFCHADADWDSLFRQFRELRADIMGTLADTPGLMRGDRRMSGVYLDSFFNILGSPESRQQRIANACQPWPPGQQVGLN
jgi:hypothetical protein